MPDTGEVTLIPKGEECDVEWKMKYAFLSEGNVENYFSPDFSFQGETWYMEIWSNGYQFTPSYGYIKVCLYRHSNNGPPIKVEFIFSFQTVNGKKYCVMQNTKVFHGSDCHAIDQFLSRSDFEKRQSEFSSSGFLTVVCTLKTLNSTGSTSNFATADCSYCKKTFDTQKLSSHEKKCRVKCPECLDVILLQNWDEHQCEISRAEAPTNATESFVVCHHNKILQDLKQAFLNQENCYVILRVKGREFQTHKFILAARSSVFASTFRNNMKEKETGVVDIEDIDPSIFSDFLCFFYCDDVESLSEKNVFGLFFAADKYDIPELKTKCAEFMKENISVETFCETLTLALLHSETELIHTTTDFFIKNAEKILVTVKWESFVTENPKQSNELVIKLVASCRCSKS